MAMIPIRELFETHLTVSDLERAKKFYSEVLGLELAQEFPERDVAFYWVGGRGWGCISRWALTCRICCGRRPRCAPRASRRSISPGTPPRSRWCWPGCRRAHCISATPTGT